MPIKQNTTGAIGRQGTTRRQQKHDLLLTFMANTHTPYNKQRTAPVRPTLLKTLLSLFL